jgi:hypothetical protein
MGQTGDYETVEEGGNLGQEGKGGAQYASRGNMVESRV